ncbi:MAG: transglycosylase domain-containing protein [Chloroflexi bacterium]|nr:transglycosylase domain-containing protein [Chloroflexota bacterium]
MNHVLLRRRLHTKKKSGGPSALRFVLVFFIALILSTVLLAAVAVGGVYTVYATYVKSLPDPGEVERLSSESFETTRIYDRTGQTLLYEIIPPDGGRRTYVSLDQIPLNLRNATIAMEDRTFYTNPGGINIEGLGRAAVGLLRGENSGGGSSIPQQLIKNVLMEPEERMERSYTRKIKELVLTFELARRYPGIEGRDKILEWYLNTVFYGHFAYGVEAAAQTYFGKSVQDLTLAEAAMLVPLGNAPAYNPWDAPEKAKERQEVVLDQMVEQGYITQDEADAAKKENIVVPKSGFALEAPHYVMYVRELLEEKFGTDAVYGGGLQVISAIDLEKQAQVEELANQHIAEIGDSYNVHNAAVVVLDAKTAEILAMVGSLDYDNEAIDGEVNMTISPRQPGSSFKIFTYATAFAQGYTPATMVLDVRTSFPDPPRSVVYVPENSDRTFHGPVLLRQALACSLNVPAVVTIHNAGVQNVLDTAHKMGITDLNGAYYGLSLTLGTGPVKLLDLTYAYSVLANSGVMVGTPVATEDYKEGFRQLDPVAILKVSDSKGNVLYEYEEPQRQEVISPQVAYLLNDILSDNNARAPFFGYDSVLYIPDRAVAVKTGTTDGYHDAWTIGYTPQYVVGVWTGNTDYEATKKATGSGVAAPLWRSVITWLHEGLPVEEFPYPDGLETATIDTVSGKLPTQYSPNTREEVFIAGTVPTTYDDVHVPFRICKASGKLATEYCPLDQVEEKVYEVFAPEADDWLRAQGIERPPTEYCDIHGPAGGALEVAITSPSDNNVVGGVVTVTGSARTGDMQYYYLEVGTGREPTEWQRIGADHGDKIERGILEMWNTAGLDGLYTLRLTVVSAGGTQQSLVRVLVDNSPPAMRLILPYQDEIYTVGVDEWINIQVLAEDNLGMSKVEFYVDDKLLGYSTVAPFSMRWMLNGSWTEVPVYGTHSIYAIGFDSAGNQVKTEPVSVRVTAN